MTTAQQDILHDLWKTEQEILDCVHEMCESNHLRYSLAYGTLLGAVRHGGFIPWDDDIDIIMPREDYERLIELWESNPIQGYILQTEKTATDLPNNFAKVRKDHTTFLQYEWERPLSYHKGIFIDIFPADRRAEGMLSGRIQKALLMIYLLYNRGFTSGAKGVKGMIEKLFLSIPKSSYRKTSIAFGRLSRMWNGKTENRIFMPSTVKGCREYCPADSFAHLEKRKFNGKEYYTFSDYDAVLRVWYGDYMKLPPEEERVWRHHPIIIDFEHNYDELDA